MYTHRSPSSANVRQNLKNYLQKSAKGILSKLDEVGVQVDSYTRHSSTKDNINYKYDDKYYQITDKYDDEYNQNHKYEDGYNQHDIYEDEYNKNHNYEDDNNKNYKYDDEYNQNHNYEDEYNKNDKYDDEYYENNDKYDDKYYQTTNKDFKSKVPNRSDIFSSSPDEKLVVTHGMGNQQIQTVEENVSERNPGRRNLTDITQVVPTATYDYKVEFPYDQSYMKDYNNNEQDYNAILTGLGDNGSNSHQFFMEDGKSMLNATSLENNSTLHLSQTMSPSSSENHHGIWHRGEKGFVPPKTAPVATSKAGLPLYAGRVSYEGNLIPAIILPESGVAYFSWNGKIFCTRYYDIFEIHNFAWIDEGSARESLNVIPIGLTADGKPLHLGRVYVEGMGPWVGRVHRDEKHIYIPFRGNELRIPQPYEVFVTY